MRERKGEWSRREFLSAGAGVIPAALAAGNTASGKDDAPPKQDPDKISPELAAKLFPPLPGRTNREGKRELIPNDSGMLEVSKEPPHTIYWAEYGNPHGEPLLYVHGGPGADISRVHLRMMDPEHYRIIAFNQRAAGKSRFGKEQITGAELAERLVKGENVDPLIKEMLDGNTTPELISDMVKLRKHLKLGDKRMHVFGGSWGSYLALTYAIEHPDTVKSLTLRGVYLGRDDDNKWSYQCNAADPKNNRIAGAHQFYPEEWKKFVGFIPEGERHDMFAAYKNRMTDNDPKVREEAAKRFLLWEEATSQLNPAVAADMKANDAHIAIPASLLEIHYFGNGCFMPDDAVLGRLDRIKDIPTHIVQGRFDSVCPLYMTTELVDTWNQVQENPLRQPEVAIMPSGHYAQELKTAEALVKATNTLAEWDCSGRSWERFRQQQQEARHQAAGVQLPR